MPKITRTYETITPESAENNDVAERGWLDRHGFKYTKLEQLDCDIAVEIAPDEYDLEEYDGNLDTVIAYLAAKYISNDGFVEPSSSHFTAPDEHCSYTIWYTHTDGMEDFRTGARTYYSYHLDEFTPEQQKLIFDLLTHRR